MPAFRPVVNIFFQIYEYTNCWIYYPASKYLAAIDTHKNMGETSIALRKVKLAAPQNVLAEGCILRLNLLFSGLEVGQ